jgi:uncharacterized membrane protein
MAGEEQASDDGRLFGAAAYIFGIVIALLIYLVKKEDRYVRYHALQAIFFDLALTVITFPIMIAAFTGFFFSGIIGTGAGFFAGFWIIWLFVMAFALLSMLIRLVLAYKAFRGTRFRLPFIGAQAEKMTASQL